MQVQFKWGTRERLDEVRKTNKHITEAEVYFDPTDGSLYVVSLKKKDDAILNSESKNSFSKYIEAEMETWANFELK